SPPVQIDVATQSQPHACHDIGRPMGYDGLRHNVTAMAPDQCTPQGRDNMETATYRSPAGSAGDGLSIVVPVYNESAGLVQLHARTGAVATALHAGGGLACEIVYVDDGSRDASLDVARGLPANAADIQVVSLSRNFGKEAALLAGLEHARRGAVLFMDA